MCDSASYKRVIKKGNSNLECFVHHLGPHQLACYLKKQIRQ